VVYQQVVKEKFMKKIVLASGSPRRKEILEKIGLNFVIDPAQDFKEIHPENHSPKALLELNALGKAREVSSRHENSLILGVDTIGVFRGEILEKPKDRADAIRMISILEGEVHEVWTAMALIDTETGKERIVIEKTKITFAELTNKEIEQYVDFDESMDKAAAYAAQGKAALFIKGFEGDYLNVVGLPLARLNEVLKEFDFHILDNVE